MRAIEGLNDPLLSSVFKQAKVLNFDPASSRLDVQFSKEFSFFNDWLNETVANWLPLLKNAYSPSVIFNPLFTATSSQEKKPVDILAPVALESKPRSSQPPVSKANESYAQKNERYPNKDIVQRTYQPTKQPAKLREPVISVSDAALWPKASLLLSYFPGSITQMKEVEHER